MARGGKRAGAGRKTGAATQRTREIADAAAAAGITPLEYMLDVMRDTKADLDRRDAMARAAAPYMHPALKAIEHKGDGGGPLKIEIVRFSDSTAE